MDTTMRETTLSQSSSSDPASKTCKSSFNFFGLPAELRDRIYDLSVQSIVAEDDDRENICPMAQRGMTAERLNPALSMTNRQIRSEFLPRYHRARGLVFSLRDERGIPDDFEKSIDGLAYRIPMTRYFILNYAKDTIAACRLDSFHCRIALVGGVMYERYLQHRPGQRPTAWLPPRVTYGHSERQEDLREQVKDILQTFQDEQGDTPLVANAELLRRVMELLQSTDSRFLADGSRRDRGDDRGETKRESF